MTDCMLRASIAVLALGGVGAIAIVVGTLAYDRVRRRRLS